MLVKTTCFSPLHIFIARMNSNDYKMLPVLSDEEFYDLLDEIGGYMPFGLRAYHFVCTNQLLQNPIGRKVRWILDCLLYTSDAADE